MGAVLYDPVNPTSCGKNKSNKQADNCIFLDKTTIAFIKGTNLSPFVDESHLLTKMYYQFQRKVTLWWKTL